MGLVTLPAFGSDPASVTGPLLDGKVDPLATEFNGSIENVNIKAGAAIAYSKLNLATSIVNADISTSAAIVASKLDLGTIAQDINEAKGADVASATTTTIWVTDGNIIHVTGTTTITSFGTAGQAGAERTVVFDGALILTHNATSLILPTGANITTAAGDVAVVRAETTANARVVVFMRKDGRALVAPTAAQATAGSVVQVVNTLVVTSTTGTTVVPYDDTIPQSSEGDEYMTLAITPNATANKLMIEVVFNGANSAAGDGFTVALLQDSTADALNAQSEYIEANELHQFSFIHYMAAGTTSATTFKVRAGGGSAGTTTFNGASGARKLGGILASSITITEIKV